MTHIYIASNQAFTNGILKIGSTSNTPSIRVDSLSKSTSIPYNFKLEYSRFSEYAKLVERRAHAVLYGHRVNANKEFFDISLNEAIHVIDTLIDYAEIDGAIGTRISKHSDLISAWWEPQLSARDINLINFIIASTSFLSLRKAVKMTGLIIDGFLSSSTISKFFKIEKSSAAEGLKRIQRKGMKLEVTLSKSNTTIKVFQDIQYHRGELWWLFNDEFVYLIGNNKL